MNYLGGVFYINLDKRPDRKAEIETELNNIGLKYERFSAVDMKPGLVGCGYSHIEVLKLARERGLKNVLIFEDDFQSLVSKEEFWESINNFFKSNIQYDVLMLSYNLFDSSPVDNLLIKVKAAQTTSGYIVNSYFYDTLIDLWEDSQVELIRTNEHWVYGLDQIWKTIQPQNNWYAFKKRLGRQRPSYSDISETFLDRDV